MNQRTVVAWDATDESRAAVTWALARARHLEHGHEFVLAHVIDDNTYVPGKAFGPGHYDTAGSPTADDVAAVQEQLPNGRVSSQIVIGDPLTSLRRFTDPSTLLVVGTEARTGAHFRFAWAIGTRLAATALGPVAVIPQQVTGIRSGVVAGIDGSETSIRAALFAAAEANRRRESLRLINAWLEPPIWQEPLVFDNEYIDEDYFQTVARQHEELVTDAAAIVHRSFPDLAVTAEEVRGHIVRSLLNASPLPSLVVVGCRSRNAWNRFVLGSVSHELLLNLDTPVVVVSDRVRDGVSENDAELASLEPVAG